jgi:hypothetical protein
MIRGIDARLRKLEGVTRGRRVWFVWAGCAGAAPAECERRKAEMIASGQASPDDELICFQWLPPGSLMSNEQDRAPSSHGP